MQTKKNWEFIITWIHKNKIRLFVARIKDILVVNCSQAPLDSDLTILAKKVSEARSEIGQVQNGRIKRKKPKATDNKETLTLTHYSTTMKLRLKYTWKKIRTPLPSPLLSPQYPIHPCN